MESVIVDKIIAYSVQAFVDGLQNILPLGIFSFLISILNLVNQPRYASLISFV